MLVTLDTSQDDMLLLDDDTDSNMPNILVTLYTSQDKIYY